MDKEKKKIFRDLMSISKVESMTRRSALLEASERTNGDKGTTLDIKNHAEQVLGENNIAKWTT